MSIFSTILEKLGLGKETPKPAQATPKPAAAPPKPADVPYTPKPTTYTPPKPAAAPPKPAAAPPMSVTAPPMPVTAPPKPAAATPKPEPIPMVDVVANLEKKAAKLGTPSNWKTSIADLLFLLGMDHSYEARKELAVELGCPKNLMDDSAKMNTWLHKTVLTKIAENGGNIPKELLD